MAFYQFLCGLSLMTIFSFGVCNPNMPKHPACGKQPQNHHLPWQVVLTIDGKHRCLGSLLNSHMVLTDHHCRLGPAQQTKVFLGRMDMSNPIKASEEMRTVVDVSCDTPPHSSPIRRDGVCVLTLSMPVNFTDTLYPICLPSGDSNFITGMESYVATGSALMPKLKVPVIGYHVCKCYNPIVKSHMFCAGEDWKFGSQERCVDDLGGPLMIHHHDCMVQIGVVRFDSNCPTPASARPYINTASFADFIKNVTQSEPACMVPVFPGKNPEAGFKCPPTETPKPPKCPNPSSPDCNDDSVFSSGVNVISSFRIISLCLLGFMFYSTY